MHLSSTAVLRRVQDTKLRGCTKSKQDLALSSRLGQAPSRSAQHTYKDSNAFGGTDDGPTWRGIFGDVLHCDGSQVDSCW